MSTRRNFFKFLSIGTAAAAGGVVTAATLIAPSGKSDAVKKIEAAGFNGKLTLGAEYDERKQKQVSMAVGPDGELYLMTNGKWRKIVTE